MCPGISSGNHLESSKVSQAGIPAKFSAGVHSETPTGFFFPVTRDLSGIHSKVKSRKNLHGFFKKIGFEYFLGKFDEYFFPTNLKCFFLETFKNVFITFFPGVATELFSEIRPQIDQREVSPDISPKCFSEINPGIASTIPLRFVEILFHRFI